MQLKISTVGLGAMIPPILVHQPQFYVIENYVHLIYFAKSCGIKYIMWNVAGGCYDPRFFEYTKPSFKTL